MLVESSDLIRNLEKKWENFSRTFTVKAKYGATAAVVTPIVILASLYIRWGCARRAWKSKNNVVYARSTSLGALQGGNLALERLIDYHNAQAEALMQNAAEIELRELLGVEHPNFRRLQSTAAKLEMRGQEAIAAEILKKKLQEVQKLGKSHEAYEIEMLLAEMYIYQGDWKKALACQCLQHEEISDARRPLFKAIIYIMLKGKRKDEAIEYWEEFKNIRALFLSPENCEDSEILKIVNDFNQFEKIVASLKHDISR